MVDLSKARKLASLVRLSDDKSPETSNFQDLRAREDHKDIMLRHGVLISKSVTPVLEDRLAEVCNILNIPRENVTAFVYNSAEVQADCLIDSPDTCVLRFTSGLVNLMDEQEFKFVAGHELGHFLLGHGACSEYLSEGSLEDYIVRRARELSADRIGYLAICSLEKSIQAIIKTASGLSEQFLRLDVSSLMSQAKMISNPSKGEAKNSSHPSMLMRCKALLWFSMPIHSISDLEKLSEWQIKEIDSRVIKDLEKFVDGQIRIRKTELEGDVALWKSVLLIFHSGSFSKEAQNRFSQILGDEILRSVNSFFELYSGDNLLDEISLRLDGVLSSALNEFPKSAKKIENAGFEIAYRIVEGID